jgi:heptose I phosphotransferase
LVEELGGFQELHEAIPELAATLDRASFQRFKRAMIRDLVQIVAKLHRFGFFHKDLYLCHFLLERSSRSAEEPRLALIDLHRLGQHAWFPQRWRWKDLGQLLFSSYGVDGIDDRDRLRFWTLYRKRLGLRAPRWQMRAIRRKASRYLSHNR